MAGGTVRHGPSFAAAHEKLGGGRPRCACAKAPAESDGRRSRMLIDALTFTLKKSEALDPVWDALDEGHDATLGVAASARPFLVAARFAARPAADARAGGGGGGPPPRSRATSPRTWAMSTCFISRRAPTIPSTASRAKPAPGGAPHGGPPGRCRARARSSW